MGAATDTIAAIATPPGKGGIGIVRVSGPRTQAMAREVLRFLPSPRTAVRARFFDRTGDVIDDGLVLYFPAPGSFSGEDMLELHGHGGPVVLDMLLGRLLEAGARMARPGEFSERAFLNDKMDLAQAEAVADLIDSATQTAARGALRSLKGEFSERVNAIVDALVELRTYVEGAIDFPEDEIDFLAEGDLEARLATVMASLERLDSAAQQGCLLRDGVSVVIAGRPNVGKSSLLNRLSGRDAAIVTAIPGTTRDVLREYVHLDGLPVHVVDTAGLRSTDDPIEFEGVDRARREIREADVVLAMVDDREPELDDAEQLFAEIGPGPARLLARNKVDLSGNPPGLRSAGETVEVRISAKTGAGIEALKQCLKDCVGYREGAEGSFTARRRHREALASAMTHGERALTQLRGRREAELVAEDLRLMQRALGEITGAFSTEDLLDRIFSSFCIGK
ncbi:MAG: tRNA uridine-5-carboxymethylaminomethyl(34) synthesis GTPase MnmE [Gammaproteobacteria bacterium]|nr:tRNA uridine-5-carboxymethylaminomethyl(34) synthesis GTPase MnmE [Gammaproteobacteria bacterium]